MQRLAHIGQPYHSQTRYAPATVGASFQPRPLSPTLPDYVVVPPLSPPPQHPALNASYVMPQKRPQSPVTDYGFE